MRLRMRVALALNWLDWKIAGVIHDAEWRFLSDQEREDLSVERMNQYNAYADKANAREAARETA